MVSALPSKKIFLLIIACVIGIGAISFAVFASKMERNSKNSLSGASLSAVLVNEITENSQAADLIRKTLVENSNRDDDSDDLMNWEETLWGTSPDNSDSDGDGTKDGEEVKANRNPAKVGPQDELSTSLANSSGASSGTTNGQDGSSPGIPGSIDGLETTQTSQISRDLFANYLKTKQSGVVFDENTQREILEQTLSNSSLTATLKIYSRGDIQISSNADLKTYGNALGSAFYTGKSNGSATEMEILQTALENNTPDDLTQIDPIIAGYTAVLNALLATQVPQSLVDSHLELVNALNKVLTDIKDLRKIFEDPVVGLIGVSTYYNDIDALRVATASIQSIFQQKGVTFSNTEPGYVFFKITQ